MRLKFLGTGAAGGVPVYGCTCQVCQAAQQDPTLGRQPCSILVESAGEKILVDGGLPDLHQRFPPNSLSRILLSHYHVDHVQGLFHLRWGCNMRIPVHGPADPSGCADLFTNPGILDFSPVMNAFQTETFGRLQVTPVPLSHSKITLGYCVTDETRRLAYLCDTVGLPVPTLSFLKQWQPSHIILDCTHPPHQNLTTNHNDFTMAVTLGAQFNSTSLWLTHISHDFDLWLRDHQDLLPSNIQIAADGLELF